jgi:hypothetical protein
MVWHRLNAVSTLYCAQRTFRHVLLWFCNPSARTAPQLSHPFGVTLPFTITKTAHHSYAI